MEIVRRYHFPFIPRSEVKAADLPDAISEVMID